ncbi:Small G protein signaling modulator 1 like protein [Argiope bruennichi]|uniref:Small G protein signaling modulator 1 like protein n=1 Tax=Argiope bruennichi TaxID=94029 RepID=A0A8T0E499_ARGBR|nr:Small G protein signaling modulator 1 like protein [Argiope bruennichi]
MSEQNNSEKEYREKLLRMVKKEVKQIMEEAVTRKFVHEDSSSITSLCAAVDACLSHSLKRRALGLFKTNSTTALLQKLSKNCEEAAEIARTVAEMENIDPNKRSASSSDSTNKLRLKPEKRQSSSPSLNQQPNPRFLWIRLALFEKKLAKIVDHLVHNASKYYEKEALISDPVCGQIFASLLVGPCALDYSKMKTQDHFWTDPPADELVQRHRLSTGVPLISGPSTPPSVRRPALQYKRDTRISTEDCCRVIPRGYVESLHQNSKSTLLYGKNNVLVQPKEHLEPMPGYLSLHQNPDGLIIKWTPNQLMNGCYSTSDSSSDSVTSQDKSIYWEYAMSVSVDDIVYLHCHQNPDTGGTIVLVGQDGVQHPPIHFPKGGHLLAFLSCLENGLLPHGQMDPPLWSQRGRGKVFPKLRRKCRGSFRRHSKDGENGSEEDGEATDYVFRIITSLKPDSISPEMLDPKINLETFAWQQKESIKHLPHHSSSSTTSTSSSKSLADENSIDMGRFSLDSKEDKPPAGQSIQILCDTMKKQIISRAFYGWLAHCRHLRTVRTHLAGLVNSSIVSETYPTNASQGLTKEIWIHMHNDSRVTDSHEVYRLTYFGGVDPSIRKEVWPYLLGHYAFGSTESERQEHNMSVQTSYETTMSEWLAVEAIVKQRDKEQMAANLAKLSSESTNSEIPLVGPKDANLSNDVFEDMSSTEYYENPEDDILEEPEEEEKSKTMNDKEAENTETSDHAEENKEVDIEDKCQASLEEKQISRVRYLRHMQAIESQSILITNSSVEAGSPVLSSPREPPCEEEEKKMTTKLEKEEVCDDADANQLETTDPHSACISPASSGGGVYSWYLLETRKKLRNVMCTYVWEHLEMGYVQGMCDLVAPLLVIFDDEMLSYSCFCEIMKRMVANFPHGGAMDAHFANMRSLIQMLKIGFDLMHQNGDYTHFYFCYRWFLLDFKRELLYDDVFIVWESIWAAKHVASSHFVLFIALALVEYYRDIILENNMDFTDIIKFFNEMAERHDAKAVLKIARDLVCQIQTLIDNKRFSVDGPFLQTSLPIGVSSLEGVDTGTDWLKALKCQSFCVIYVILVMTELEYYGTFDF